MEFHEKLQELRKQRGLTQEELAQALYVSRTAISKWESGRGYPNIESLKAIARFFLVTVDELLSSDQVLCIAEEEQKQKARHLRDLMFGLSDLCALLLLFLPFFAAKVDNAIESVSLLNLDGVQLYLKIFYFVLVIGMIAMGLLTLILQSCRAAVWLKTKVMLSLVLGGAAVLLFIISLQPYAAVFALILFGIKAGALIKRQ